jgi:hypothetical protein
MPEIGGVQSSPKQCPIFIPSQLIYGICTWPNSIESFIILKRNCRRILPQQCKILTLYVKALSRSTTTLPFTTRKTWSMCSWRADTPVGKQACLALQDMRNGQIMDQRRSQLMLRVVIPGVWRPFGGRTRRAGGWPYPLRLIWTGRGTVDREITVPNLVYCSNFSYYFPPTWSCGGWQSEMVAYESGPVLGWPSKFTMGVSQCPFDLYQAGAKVYRAYRAGGRPAPQTTLLMLMAQKCQVEESN